MFFPIVIVVQEDDAEAAQAVAQAIADDLAERYGEDDFGLSMFDGSDEVPAISVYNGDEG